MLLESIYEPNFSKNSHGFRPKKGCHTALLQIQNNFTGIKWFVEGDIKACFDSFDHHVLISILRRRIHDENFIALIWKLLKAGYMEQWQHHKTFSGTPQGGLCKALHKPPYEKLNIMQSNKLKPLYSKGFKSNLLCIISISVRDR